MLFVLRRNNIGPDLGPGQNPATNAAPPGTGAKPGHKCSAARFAHPLRGAEVLAHAICSEQK